MPRPTEAGVSPAAKRNAATLASEFAAGLEDLDGSVENHSMLIYGDPGCGKTVLAGTAPGRKLFLAGEPGFISAARQGATGKVRICSDTRTALGAINWLEDGGYKEFDWIIPDGISTMNAKWILGYAAEAWDANPAKRVHRNLPDKPDYFNAQNFMKDWVSRLVDLPVNVLFTAHAMRTMDRDEGELYVRPSIQGKEGEVSNYVSGLMYAVGYMSERLVKEGKGPAQSVRRILWQTRTDPNTDVRYFAKDQYDAFGTYTDDTNMPGLLSLIEPATTSPPKKSRR